jgi:hypothetical protein
VISAFILAVSSYAASVELEWIVKADINVVAYSISYGKINSPLTTTTKLGKIYSVRIDTITEGDTYWFQITPILASGGNGTPSNIIYYKAPSKRIDDTHSAPQLKVKPPTKKNA